MTTSTVKKAGVVDQGRTASSQLVGLSIIESSGVREGDNPEAHVVATKNKPAEQGVFSKLFGAMKEKFGAAADAVKGSYDPTPRTTNQILAANEMEEEFWELRCAYSESMYSIMSYCTDMEQMGTMLVASTQEFADGAKKLVSDMKAGAEKAREFDGIIDSLKTSAGAMGTDGNVAKKAPFIEQFREGLKKLEQFTFSAENAAPAVSAQPDVTSKNSPEEEPVMFKTVEEALKALRDPKNTNHEAALKFIEEDGKATKDAKDKAEAAAKAAAAGVQDGAIMAQLKSMGDKLEASDKKIAALLAEKDTNSFMNKARKVAPPGVDPKKLAKQLEGAFGRSKEEGEELESMFRALKAQSRFSETLGNEMGTSQSGDADANSAQGELQAKAKELQAKEPGLHWGVAYKRACDQNPQLREAALAEERGDDEGEEG